MREILRQLAPRLLTVACYDREDKGLRELAADVLSAPWVKLFYHYINVDIFFPLIYINVLLALFLPSKRHGYIVERVER
ncbi:hypothetical protein SDJN03_25441, partial [Cucurbita argyrosperma subsp. sororia]